MMVDSSSIPIYRPGLVEKRRRKARETESVRVKETEQAPAGPAVGSRASRHVVTGVGVPSPD